MSRRAEVRLKLHQGPKTAACQNYAKAQWNKKARNINDHLVNVSYIHALKELETFF